MPQVSFVEWEDMDEEESKVMGVEKGLHHPHLARMHLEKEEQEALTFWCTGQGRRSGSRVGTRYRGQAGEEIWEQAWEEIWEQAGEEIWEQAVDEILEQAVEEM